MPARILLWDQPNDRISDETVEHQPNEGYAMSGPVPGGTGSERATDPAPKSESAPASKTDPENAPVTATPAAAARQPVIRPTVLPTGARSDWLLKAGAPAWLISSVVHALILVVLICTIGSARQPAETASSAVINTSAPDTNESDTGYPIEVDLGKHEIDTRAAGDTTASDAIDATLQGLNDVPGLATGSADDKSATPLNSGDLLAGLGSFKGGDAPYQGFAGSGTANFFGTAARGNRFAILADNSGSMQGAPLMYLKTEITNTLARSRGSAQFYVTFFSSEATPQPLKRWTTNRTDVTAVSTWVKGVETANGTVPITGFEHVLRLKPPPDVVYFMTDGEFDPREVEQIRKLNQTLNPPAVIHTIAFVGQKGERELRQIAKEAKGTYRFIPGPKK